MQKDTDLHEAWVYFLEMMEGKKKTAKLHNNKNVIICLYMEKLALGNLLVIKGRN